MKTTHQLIWNLLISILRFRRGNLICVNMIKMYPKLSINFIDINSGRVLGRMIGEGGSHVNKDCPGARLEGFADGVKVVD